jgi:hypothetical protein
MREVRTTDFMGIVDGKAVRSARDRYEGSDYTYTSYEDLIEKWDSKIKKYELPPYIIKIYGKGYINWEDRYKVKPDDNDLIAFFRAFNAY